MKGVHEFRLVGGRKHSHIGNHARIDQVEHAVVRRPIGAHQARAVDSEHDIEVHEGVIDDKLIDGALQERGVHGEHRLAPADSEPRRHASRVLLANAHVDEAIGEFLFEVSEPRAAFHRGGDRDNALIGTRLIQKGLPEHRSVTRRLYRLLYSLARGDIVRTRTMETRRLRHRGTIPGALLGDHVHEHRAICGQARREHFLQLVDVVPVDRRRAHDAQLLEDHGVGNDELLHRFLRVAPEVHEGAAEGARLLHSLLHAIARRTIRR